MNALDFSTHEAKAEALLKAVSHPTRLAVLCALRDREHSVNELLDELQLGQSTLSQQLARLRLDRLVLARREGQRVFYSLADQRISKLLAALHECVCVNADETAQENRRLK